MGVGPSNTTVNGWLAATFCAVPYVVTSLWLELHLGDPASGGLANIADTDARQLATFALPSPDGVVVTAGAPPQYVINADATITHGSLHTEIEGGDWVWNLVARSPIQVVAGDLLIVGDGMEFRIDGWTS